MATFIKIDGWGGLLLLLVVIVVALVYLYPEAARSLLNGLSIPEVAP